MDHKDINHKSVADIMKAALFCKCPRCNKGALFNKGIFALDVKDQCEDCGFDYTKSDSADGPAVFLIFFLGFLLVPLALWVEMKIGWPLWLHVVIWGSLGLIITLGSLKPIKALVIGLQYRYRATDWDDTPPPRV